MNSFTIKLESAADKHLYEQIYEYIRNEIREGKLLYQEKLPSTRALAEYLQVSRSTVELAYEQLLSEGYIESRPYKGYYVCKIEELYHIHTKAEQPVTEPEQGEDYEIDFSPNVIDLEAFPFDTWRKITKSVLHDGNRRLFQLGPAKGDWELRSTIGRYLHASRGVNCSPEQIIVGAGNDYLLMLLRKILGEGLHVAIETPTYQKAYQMFHSFGYQVHSIAMDEAGMDVERLRESQAQLAYVMPSHQYPTGIVMPIGRRMELLRWAAEGEGRYLIEDDYDSEFRYKGKPIPSLQASDSRGRVIYIGTFSKSIAPSIRISYMVLPMELLARYTQYCSFLSSTVSRIDQAVLNVFIRDGYYERHLNKMRKIYKMKHDLMLQLLRAFDQEYTVRGDHAGLHLLLEAKGSCQEEELIRRAREEGIRVYGMGEREKRQNKKPTLILGYAGLTQQQIQVGMQRLRKAILHSIQ